MKQIIRRYIISVMANFGLSVLALTVCVTLFGDSVKGEAAVFALGSAGVPSAILLQWLLAVTVVMAFVIVFLTDIVIKDMKPGLRVILAMLSAFVTMLCFILVCGWFSPEGLLVFVPVFAVAFPVNAVRIIRRERRENDRLAEALRAYKSAQ